MGQSGARWEIHELDPTSGPMAGLPAMRSQTEIMRKASTSSCEKDRGGGGGRFVRDRSDVQQRHASNSDEPG